MDITSVLIAAAVVGVVGILSGILLGVASEKFKVKVDEKEIQIREILPGNNCGGCGFPGCDGLAAAIAAGVYKDYKEAAQHMVHISDKIEPNPEMTAIYQKKYEKYRAVSKALDTVWGQFEV